MKRPFLLPLAAGIIPLALTLAAAAHEEGGKASKAGPSGFVNATCPGSGKAIDPGVTTTFASYKVGFCCPDCIQGFEAKSAAEKAAFVVDHVMQHPVNATCPGSGKPIDATVTTTYEGTKVGFCCPDCIEAFTSKPAEEKDAFVAHALAAALPVNTECPVSGKPIDPAQAVVRDGFKIATCCDKCVGKVTSLSQAELRDLLIESLVARAGAGAAKSAASQPASRASGY